MSDQEPKTSYPLQEAVPIAENFVEYNFKIE